MPITVVISNSDGIIHGTDNGKKTGCGIRYSTGDNLRKYKQGEVLTDLIIAMKTLNCEKCRRVLSSKMIKEDRKAENKREKEESKRIADAIKRGDLDADGNPIIRTEETNIESETLNESIPISIEQPISIQDDTISEPMEALEQVEDIEQTTSDEFITSNTIVNQEIQSTIEDDDFSEFLYEPQKQSVEPIKNIEPILEDDDFSKFIVNPAEMKFSEQEVIKKKPLENIDDILADLDVLMSNISVKNPESIQELSSPILEDVAPLETYQDIQELSSPILEDVAPLETSQDIQELSSPILEDVTPLETSQDIQELSSPILEDVAPLETSQDIQELSSPILEDVAPLETSQDIQELSSPILEDVTPLETSQDIQELYNNTQKNINHTPIQPINNYIPPVTPIQTPQPMPLPQFYYNAYGEAIPITYNAQNQPVFTVPVTYDIQGQPRLIQVSQPTVPNPQPYIPQNQYTAPQPTYTQPVSPPPTRVVRADAPPLISKPSESNPFNFSVFEKENKRPVFNTSENRIFVDSIEEALNQLGVEIADKKEEDEIMPEFQEYVVPTKNSPSPPPVKEVETKATPVLSEAERKKREKIDAKLKKEWEKKGLDPNAWKRMKH